MSARDLPEDTLFVACTRPAMIQGVPLEAFVLNGMFSLCTLIMTNNPLLGIGIGIPIHFLLQAVCRQDYNIFRLLMIYSKTKGRSLNKDLWGGSSVSPLPLLPARKPHEVRIHA